ncbi:uncharacterized protein LOC120333280 [Styela clava]
MTNESETSFLNSTMANLKNATSDLDLTNVIIISQAVNAILLSLSSWIFISMIYYGMTNENWKKNDGRSKSNSKLAYYICMLSIALLVPRYSIYAAIFQLPSIENALQWCELISDVAITIRLLSRYAMYFFLWLRQKLLYAHPSTLQLGGKYVNAISWLALAGITLTFVGIICNSIIPKKFIGSTYGCVKRTNLSSYPLVGALLGTGLTLSQVLLLGLFIYPVIRSDKVMQRHNQSPTKKASTNKVHNQSRRFSCIAIKSSSPVGQIIYRCIVGTIIAILSDVLGGGLKSVLPHTIYPRSIMDTIFGVSTFINAYCALTTFKSHWSILCVLFRKKNRENIKERRENRASPPSAASVTTAV